MEDKVFQQEYANDYFGELIIETFRQLCLTNGCVTFCLSHCTFGRVPKGEEAKLYVSSLLASISTVQYEF
jgi:hypothetical protein